MPTPLPYRLAISSFLALGLVTNHALGDSDIESQRASARTLIPVNSGASNQAPYAVAYFPDGKHYLIATPYAGVDIFNTETAARVTEEPIEPLFAGNPPGDPSSHIKPRLVNAGIIDDNTYYYAAEDIRTKPNDIRVNIQQIAPPPNACIATEPTISEPTISTARFE